MGAIRNRHVDTARAQESFDASEHRFRLVVTIPRGVLSLRSHDSRHPVGPRRSLSHFGQSLSDVIHDFLVGSLLIHERQYPPVEKCLQWVGKRTGDERRQGVGRGCQAQLCCRPSVSLVRISSSTYYPIMRITVRLMLFVFLVALATAPATSQNPRDVIAELDRNHPDIVLEEMVSSPAGAGPGLEDRVGRIAAAFQAHDRATAQAVQQHPNHGRIVLRRAALLRRLGRDSEALALLAPWLGDVSRTMASDPVGSWLINEAAFAHAALGQYDRAVELMAQLMYAPDAILFRSPGPTINHAALLWDAREPEAALAHLSRLNARVEQAGGRIHGAASMWMASTQTCALTSLQRTEEARALIESMERFRSESPAPLMRALLCANDLDRAERLLIDRLRSSEPGAVLMALQDYELTKSSPGLEALIYQRFLRLRDRPAVQAEIERVGVVLGLPLARTYYGSF